MPECQPHPASDTQTPGSCCSQRLGPRTGATAHYMITIIPRAVFGGRRGQYARRQASHRSGCSGRRGPRARAFRQTSRATLVMVIAAGPMRVEGRPQGGSPLRFVRGRATWRAVRTTTPDHARRNRTLPTELSENMQENNERYEAERENQHGRGATVETKS